MKFKAIILPLLCLFAFTCCDDDKEQGKPEVITVTGDGYQRAVLAEGENLFSDQISPLSNIHSYFIGFEMLRSKAGVHIPTTVTPDIDGFVYIIAPAGTLDGWSVLPNTANEEIVMKYTTESGTDITLNIFMRKAFAGKPVTLPALTGDVCATPIARKIRYTGVEIPPVEEEINSPD